MGKKINIGNSEGFLLNDSEKDIKNKVIDYLYDTINLSKLRYGLLDSVNKLKFLQENEHYVTPNYKGSNYFLIFMNISGKSMAFLVNRKKLSYHKNQLDMKNVVIIKFFIKTNQSLYTGTIFDGKTIKKNDTYYFLIQDCFYLMAKSLLEMDLYHKMQYLNDIINLNFESSCCNNFGFKLNNLYNYSELENLVQKIIPESDIESSGITFYPKVSGNCIIFIDKKIEKITIETKNDETVENKTLDFITNFCDFLKARTYSYENENKKKILYVTKTDIPDVYDLFENKTDSKIGIAHIPNLKISHYCKENIIQPFTKVYCIYNNKFEKWIPINIVN